MTTATRFDLFSETLDTNHRLRMKLGSLTYEDVSIRKSKNCLYRFFTRWQYSQSTILIRVAVEYKKAQKNNTLTEELVNNYQFLIDKAIAHNTKYQNKSCFFRFFHAKEHINVPFHENLINEGN